MMVVFFLENAKALVAWLAQIFLSPVVLFFNSKKPNRTISAIKGNYKIMNNFDLVIVRCVAP